jgi:hypothetical protein
MKASELPNYFLSADLKTLPKRFGDAYFKTFIDRPQNGEKTSEFFWVLLHAIGISGTVGLLIHQKHARGTNERRRPTIVASCPCTATLFNAKKFAAKFSFSLSHLTAHSRALS